MPLILTVKIIVIQNCISVKDNYSRGLVLVCRWANVNDLVQNKFRSIIHPLSHHLLDQIHWRKHQINVQDPKNLMHWLLIHLILLTLTILTQPPEQNSEAAAEHVLKNFTNYRGKHLFWSLPFFTKLQASRPATPLKIDSYTGNFLWN